MVVYTCFVVSKLHIRAVKETLWAVVFYADKEDAKSHPGQKH